MREQQINQLVGHLFRHESGKMAAVLTRLLGFQAIDVAEDIVQETLLKAMTTWRIKGVPENPAAWLYTVAKRKAIDVIRQRQVHEQHHSEIGHMLKSEWTLSPTVNQLFLENEIEDSQLRMIFACCHPSIPYESQIALILKTLCGLSIGEIANSFLTGEETIAKRLYRAKERIREENISLEAPIPATLPGRLEAVLHSIYLLFNEGYHSSHPDNVIRHDLCAEAIRLCLLLTRNNLTHTPETDALMALMCFQASRADARTTSDGSIVLLKDQDRTRWSRPLIDKGKYYLERATEREQFSTYHLEAAIAGLHAVANSFAETDWKKIVQLYTLLEHAQPSAIVSLNKAIAIGYAESAAAGLAALRNISTLNHHYLYFAALGDFCLETGAADEARSHYLQAFDLAPSAAQKALLEKKLTDARLSDQ